MTDQRTAHLARALFADLDYVLGVDPNTLAAFCVRVLDEWDGPRIQAALDLCDQWDTGAAREIRAALEGAP